MVSSCSLYSVLRARLTHSRDHLFKCLLAPWVSILCPHDYGTTNGLMLSRSSLLSKMETGRTFRCRQLRLHQVTHVVVKRSPLGVYDHELPRVLPALLGRCYLLLSQLLDRPRAVNVRSIGSGTEDSSNQGRAVLVRARQQRADSLGSAGPESPHAALTSLTSALHLT